MLINNMKNLGKKSIPIPREQPNQNKEIKIADSVLLSLFMRNNKKSATSLTPHSTGLSGIQISIPNVLKLLIPKVQNITTPK